MLLAPAPGPGPAPAPGPGLSLAALAAQAAPAVKATPFTGEFACPHASASNDSHLQRITATQPFQGKDLLFL